MIETTTSGAIEPAVEHVLKIGPDRVTRKADEVIIEAKREMPDWSVREINHVPVYFEERKYYLVDKRRASTPYAFRYVLLPWPEGQNTCARGLYTYDVETVRERDRDHRSNNVDELVHAFLLPLYPILGWLWSGMQKRLVRFGFVPHSISGVSIFTSFSLLFAQGIFASIQLNAGARAGHVMIGGIFRAMAPSSHLNLGLFKVPFALFDLLLLLALLADIPIRFARHFHEDQWSGGFLEWLVRREPTKD